MNKALVPLVAKIVTDIAVSKSKGKQNKNKIGGGSLLNGIDAKLLTNELNNLQLFQKKGGDPTVRQIFDKVSRSIGGQHPPINKITSTPSAVMTTNEGTSSMTVVKTEAYYNVVGSVGFSVSGIDFFPSAAVVPWLKGISSSFVEYKVLDLEYTYVPYVPTTTTGSVALAWTGDYADTDPPDMLGMLSTEQSMIAPAYAGSEGGQALQHFGIPKGNVVGFKVPRYTYCEGNIPKTYRNLGATKFGAAAVEMRNMYSPGRLLVATEGMANTNTVGYVFVRYKIQLLGSVKSTLNA